MNGISGVGFGLGTIPLLSEFESRSICAENPDGARGGGAKVKRDTPHGRGWKGRPDLNLEPGQKVTLADINGPGFITHMWFTMPQTTQQWLDEHKTNKLFRTVYRDIVLRIFWDGQDTPSVEAPIGDFFCCGHAEGARVVSLPINVNPAYGFNSYWPMPFAKRCRVEIENQVDAKVGGFFYQISYALGPVPQNAACFHAQWRRENPTEYGVEYAIVEGIKGRGHYVGTYLAWTQFSEGWWGEGEVKFFIDGDGEHPTICGTGTEDYIGGAWGFGDETFTAPFLGYHFCKREPGKAAKHGMYRWHIMDPIRFTKDLKVTVQPLGWCTHSGLTPLRDDVASVAYWYQTLPTAPFPKLPEKEARWPR